MNYAIKRIQGEIKSYNDQKKELNKNGLFIDFIPENIYQANALIIGKNGSYKNAPWFFNCSFPSGEKGEAIYPIVPPIIKHATTGGKKLINKDITRFHPNLYESGKVCLSIINTWDGPKWVPVLNLEKILLTIQSSVMTCDALNNEPPYNFAKDMLKKYDLFVRHQVIGIAIIEQTKNLSSCFSYFEEIIKTHFLLIARDIYEECKINAEKYKNEKYFRDPFYQKGAINSWINYIDEIQELTNSLLSQKKNEEWNNLANQHFSKNIDFETLDFTKQVKQNELDTDTNTDTDTDTNTNTDTNKTKNVNSLDLSKRPPAKTKENGTIWTCSNSNISYKIMERKNGVKYWLKIKNM